MLAIAAAITAAGILGVLGGQNTLALWSDEVTTQVGSIGVGTAELVIGGPLLPFTNALPGEERHYAFSIENTGTVDLAVSTSLSAETGTGVGHFQVRSLIIGAAENCASYDLSIYPALTATPAGAPSLIHAAEQLQVCAVVTALPEVEPTDSVEFTMLLDGVQAQ